LQGFSGSWEGERIKNETLAELAGAKLDETSSVWDRFQLGISRLEMYPQRNGHSPIVSKYTEFKGPVSRDF
jgi:hypothetical protein